MTEAVASTALYVAQDAARKRDPNLNPEKTSPTAETKSGAIERRAIAEIVLSLKDGRPAATGAFPKSMTGISDQRKRKPPESLKNAISTLNDKEQGNE